MWLTRIKPHADCSAGVGFFIPVDICQASVLGSD
jgi:hypothetical protein